MEQPQVIIKLTLSDTQVIREALDRYMVYLRTEWDICESAKTRADLRIQLREVENVVRNFQLFWSVSIVGSLK